MEVAMALMETVVEDEEEQYERLVEVFRTVSYTRRCRFGPPYKNRKIWTIGCFKTYEKQQILANSRFKLHTKN